jgi:hypothetical protein
MADQYRRTPNHEIERIEKLAQAETEAYLLRSSLTYLECCVSLMLTHLSREKVAEILIEEAKILRQLG